jgi:antitoxin ParD1/3/4
MLIGLALNLYPCRISNHKQRQSPYPQVLDETESLLICINSMTILTFLWKATLMGTRRKTITVTDQQDRWIKSQIAAGQFTNDSEYVRDLIRRDQASQADIEAIRAALIEGEESGEPQPFDSSQFKQEMAAKHADKIR